MNAVWGIQVTALRAQIWTNALMTTIIIVTPMLIAPTPKALLGYVQKSRTIFYDPYDMDHTVRPFLSTLT